MGWNKLSQFGFVVLLSFLIGLEIRTYQVHTHSNLSQNFLGSARTFSFVGILGYILTRLEPHYFILYIGGMLGITTLYALFYYNQLKEKRQSILLYLVLLIVYALGPIVLHFPYWMSALLFVLIVFILNADKFVLHISTKIDTYEFETLGKMILLSAVILPLLPREDVIPYIELSPYKIWLAVVVISAISYGGYVMQRYLFPSKGIYLTGLIGGAYSSTATTVVLATKAKNEIKNSKIIAAILAATAVMYIRLIIIAFAFNTTVAKSILLPFAILALVTFLLSIIYLRLGTQAIAPSKNIYSNPLELTTAFVFALLFVAMMSLTHFVIQNYGGSGLKILSFVVGLSDIDPFILSLLTGKYAVDVSQIKAAIFIAAGSNNVLKALYSIWFSGWEKGSHAFLWLMLIGCVTIALGIFF